MPLGDFFNGLLYCPITANVSYANQFGIGGVYTVEQVLADREHMYKYRISSFSEALTALKNIKAFQNDIVKCGCSGWGFQWDLFPTLYPVFFYFLAIVVLRYIAQEPLANFGLYMGVVTENNKRHASRLARGLRGTAALSNRNQRKLLKFQNQLWLSIFYIMSSVFGYYVQRDKPWFTLPLNTESSLHLLIPHPWTPPKELVVYYYYGLAFYFSELFSLVFIEHRIKRSDFVEYCVHHVTTLLLMLCSHIGWEHRFGAYVLFIHDVSDIMLSCAKVVHYMIEENVAREERFNKMQRKEYKKRPKQEKDGKILKYNHSFLFRYVLVENTANIMFAIFIIVFFFCRLYCLPLMGHSTFLFASKVRHGNFNMWLLVFLLNVCLQLLHIYWGILIVKMVISVFVDNQRKDIRSDEELDHAENADGTDHPWEAPLLVPYDEEAEEAKEKKNSPAKKTKKEQ